MRILLTVLLAAGSAWAQAAMPMAGKAVPELAAYENALKPILQRWNIPGASLAITDKGRLVYARGFGYADREAGIPVQPGSIFRFASISKTLTGMTILKLAEEGRLSLDAKFMDLIPNITPIPGLNFDTRMRNVTVRQLLQQTGGFDEDGSSGEFVGESVRVNFPGTSGPSPLQPSESQSRNPSEKKGQEALCALPPVGATQDESGGDLTERARSGTGAAKRFHVPDAASSAGSAAIAEGTPVARQPPPQEWPLE